MIRPKYYSGTRDVVIVLLAILLGAMFVLWPERSAGAEPDVPLVPVKATVVSPWEGVFRFSAHVGDTPLVEVGSHVTPSSVVGFIDVDIMQPQRKIEVYAGVNGVVVQVLATDGEFVNGGQPLMFIEVDPPESPITH